MSLGQGAGAWQPTKNTRKTSNVAPVRVSLISGAPVPVRRAAPVVATPAAPKVRLSGLGDNDNDAETAALVSGRDALLFGGGVATGLLLWLCFGSRGGKVSRNDGYYNLPEPTTPRRPSGF